MDERITKEGKSFLSVYYQLAIIRVYIDYDRIVGVFIWCQHIFCAAGYIFQKRPLAVFELIGLTLFIYLGEGR